MDRFKRRAGPRAAMLQSLGDVAPTVHETAYVHPSATVIGDVTLEAETSVWPGVVVRGDAGPIVVREGTNLQDNAVLHETVDIGPWATVGHAAIVHNCVVGERALVGMNAVVLDGSTVGERAIVAAGSVVTEGTDVPARSLVAGAPAEVRREGMDDTPWATTADLYAERAGRYREEADVIEE